MDLSGLSLTQRKMVNLLLDYRPHTVEELHRCLADELSEVTAIRSHITQIRKLLRRGGVDVQCQRKPYGSTEESSTYYLVRLMASPNNE